MIACCSPNRHKRLAAAQQKLTLEDMRSHPFISVFLCMVLVGACTFTKKKPDVWNTYDLRYPVPKGSLGPSRAQQYNRYIDNDAFYTPPNFGLCGSSNINCSE